MDKLERIYMEKYTLNKTPVRTANNFGINDINVNLEDFKKKEFENVMIITSKMDKIEVKDLNSMEKIKLNSKMGLNLEENYGLIITIPKGTNIEEPIIINFDFDDENYYLVDNIKIVLEESASAEFILKYNSIENIEAIHYLKQETVLEKNSSAKITIANMLDKKANSFIAIENIVKENAKLNHIIADLGSKTKISNYYTNLEGDFSENNLKTIYLGTENDLIDINYNIEVYGKKSKCTIEVQGALNDISHKNFKGTIDFKKGCENSKGIENENCMLLSDDAKSKSLPMLLCKEENVEGEHGVSTGKIDGEKLFYIMTKGISNEEAKKLIVKANFSKIIKEINNEGLQSNILNKIDENL